METACKVHVNKRYFLWISFGGQIQLPLIAKYVVGAYSARDRLLHSQTLDLIG